MTNKKFKQRCKLVGTLSALTPLHIGSGEILERKLICGQDESVVQALDVARDFENKPFIPGSSLKGAIRRKLECSDVPEYLVHEILGSAGPSHDQSRGGSVIFCNCLSQQGLIPSKNRRSPL